MFMITVVFNSLTLVATIALFFCDEHRTRILSFETLSERRFRFVKTRANYRHVRWDSFSCNRFSRDSSIVTISSVINSFVCMLKFDPFYNRAISCLFIVQSDILQTTIRSSDTTVTLSFVLYLFFLWFLIFPDFERFIKWPSSSLTRLNSGLCSSTRIMCFASSSRSFVDSL